MIPGKSHKPPHEYGVLARRMEPHESCGTYITHGKGDPAVKGKLVVLDYKTLHLAWLRLNNKDTTSKFTDVPEAELDELFRQHSCDSKKFEANIASAERAYMKEQVEKARSQEILRQQKALERAASASTKKKKKNLVTKELCVGTKLASSYRNHEAYSKSTPAVVERCRDQWTSANAGDAKKLKKGWGADCEWYDGRITLIRKNNKGVKVFVCTFDTPNKDVIHLDAKRSDEKASSSAP